MKTLCTLLSILFLVACTDDSANVKTANVKTDPPPAAASALTASELIDQATEELGVFSREGSKLMATGGTEYDEVNWSDLFERWGVWENDLAEKILDLERSGTEPRWKIEILESHLVNSGKIKDLNIEVEVSLRDSAKALAEPRER